MDVIIDYDDVCEIARALRKVYLASLAGGVVSSVKFTAGNAAGREITYNKTNIDALRTELQRYEALCALANGGTAKRRVVIAG